MSDTFGEAVYSLLAGLQAGSEIPFAVYVAGDSPANAPAAFVTYQRSAASANRMTTSAQLGLRRLQIDVYADRPSAVEYLADLIEVAVLQLSAPGSPLAIVLEGGFDRAEGTYRITDYPEIMDDGRKIHRVILTFEQREQLAI
jgi:hypothetical protein